jgi:hypothetical protein
MMMFQSGRVADAAYETHWIENVFWRRPLGLLIMRAQKTLKLTGGPFYVISYETLLAVSNICILLGYDNVQAGRLLPTKRRIKGEKRADAILQLFFSDAPKTRTLTRRKLSTRYMFKLIL